MSDLVEKIADAIWNESLIIYETNESVENKNRRLARAALTVMQTGIVGELDEEALEAAKMAVYNNGVDYAGHGPNKYRSLRYAKVAISAYLAKLKPMGGQTE